MLIYANTKTVIKLIQAGANVNLATSYEGTNAIMLAAKKGELAIVQELIKSGANLDNKGNLDGFTALMLAAESGHLKIVQTLLKAGANASLTNKQGHSALDVAKAYNYTDISKELQKTGQTAETFNDELDYAAKDLDIALVSSDKYQLTFEEYISTIQG
jgi:ankyrin repeat protein